ncbi:MAG: DsrE family protein [Verrucomicrobiae bacterium]|nr:DsrE family protein [Verrucomicrobiae bacterium]
MFKVGVLIAGVQDPGAQLEHLAAETQRRGGQVFIYLIDEGVTQVRSELMQRLRADGVNLFCCAFGARKRGIAWDESATFGGLSILADMLDNCDSFLVFGPRGISTSHETGSAERHTLLVGISDPARSSLPAELIRMAAGLRPWMSGRVDLLLEGPSVEALRGEAQGQDWPDSRTLADAVRALQRSDKPIYLCASEPEPEDFPWEGPPLRWIGPEEAGRMKKAAARVIEL